MCGTNVMKKTAVLELKKAWSKIHPPLPRTPRESQALLNALTSSFRRQLDQEYPVAEPSSSSGDRARNQSRNNGEKRRGGSGGGSGESTKADSAAHMTDQHFLNILDNPLFRVVPSKQQQLQQQQQQQTNAHGERVRKEPMAVFDELVASGLVSQETIGPCLKSQNALSMAAKEGRVESMRASRAGSKFLSWWHSIDSEQRAGALLWPKVTMYVVRFLVAERQQQTVLSWWRMAIRGGQDALVVRDPGAIGTMLGYFLQAETGLGQGGLKSALAYHHQACQMVSAANDQPLEQVSKPCQHALSRATAMLNRSIILRGLDGTKGVPGPLYDEYMDANHAVLSNTLLAHAMPVYHPTTPDPWHFHRQLDRDAETARSLIAAKSRHVLTRAIFDTLRLLIDKDEFDDATRLARTIQDWLNNSTEASWQAEDLLGRLEEAATT